jgi:hypothetical protein
LILAAAHNSSLMVWPLGVSLAVEGHLTNSRLMIGPLAFGGIVVSKKFINLNYKAISRERPRSIAK